MLDWWDKSKVGGPMIKRDAAQDGDRAHFYSQYWIDVAPDLASGYEATGAAPVLPVDAPPEGAEETEPEMESLEEYEADELEYDEDEEDDEWGAQRGKKKPAQRRERHREF